MAAQRAHGAIVKLCFLVLGSATDTKHTANAPNEHITNIGFRRGLPRDEVDGVLDNYQNIFRYKVLHTRSIDILGRAAVRGRTPDNPARRFFGVMD